jgi:rSAM-associated Gly-rich repeat protein
MPITSRRTGLLGFLLALAAAFPAAVPAAAEPPGPAIAAASIESRLSRIAAAIRERESQLPEEARLPSDQQVAYGFANRVGGGGFVNGRGGTAFRNVHPYYGGYPRGFVNGGGGFVNARPGGSFVNAPYRGGAFRNW